ncbi:hypothetical protein NF212_03115 [Parasalinivibrio latis]|uniref:hypothetical protein n=1 Tax=Parasalinivibrio latis TaxID=2952610 RepID=UPI0030E131B4
MDEMPAVKDIVMPDKKSQLSTSPLNASLSTPTWNAAERQAAKLLLTELESYLSLIQMAAGQRDKWQEVEESIYVLSEKLAMICHTEKTIGEGKPSCVESAMASNVSLSG